MAALQLEGGRVRKWAPKAAKLNADGEVVEEAKLQIVFEVDLEHAEPHMRRLAQAFRKDSVVTLNVDFIEQLPLKKAAEGGTD